MDNHVDVTPLSDRDVRTLQIEEKLSENNNDLHPPQAAIRDVCSVSKLSPLSNMPSSNNGESSNDSGTSTDQDSVNNPLNARSAHEEHIGDNLRQSSTTHSQKFHSPSVPVDDCECSGNISHSQTNADDRTSMSTSVSETACQCDSFDKVLVCPKDIRDSPDDRLPSDIESKSEVVLRDTSALHFSSHLRVSSRGGARSCVDDDPEEKIHSIGNLSPRSRRHMEDYIKIAREKHTRFLKRENRRSNAEYERLLRQRMLDEVADALKFECWYPFKPLDKPCLCNKCTIQSFELHEILTGDFILVASLRQSWDLLKEVCENVYRFPLLRAGQEHTWILKRDNVSCNGWTALHFAAHFDRVDVLKALLRYGDVDVDTPFFPEQSDGKPLPNNEALFRWGQPIRVGEIVRACDTNMQWRDATIVRVDRDTKLLHVLFDRRFEFCPVHAVISYTGWRIAPMPSSKRAQRAPTRTDEFSKGPWTPAQCAMANESYDALKFLLVQGASVFNVENSSIVATLRTGPCKLYRQTCISMCAQKNKKLMDIMVDAVERRRRAQFLQKQHVNDLMYQTQEELPRDICTLIVDFLPELAQESELSRRMDKGSVGSGRFGAFWQSIYGLLFQFQLPLD